MSLLATLAIVVVPHVSSPPPPPATSPQMQCKYSVRISGDTYKCYSEKEWNDKEYAEAQQVKSEMKQMQKWAEANWWKVLIVFSAVVLLSIAVSSYIKSIDRKRNPWKYDEYGDKKYPW